MYRIKFLFIVISLFVLNFRAVAQSENPEILIEELEYHVKFLSSDELEGRAPGTGNDIKAAEYLIKELQKTNAKLLYDNGMQYFEVFNSLSPGKSNKLKINGEIESFETGFTVLPYSANGIVNSQVVFAGYGFQIDEPELKWDDYKGIDVKDKIVMIFRGAPTSDKIYENYSSLRKKITTARDNGALAVIFVNPEGFDKDDKLISSSSATRESAAAIPAVNIKRDIANKILKPVNLSITDLEKQYASDKKPASISSGSAVELQTDMIQNKVQTMNVVAMIEGSDPVLKDEYIVIGAHFDHLGWGGSGSGSRRPELNEIHNGADDNASGTSAALEIFERYALAKKPLRSIIFVAFGAEEMGLIGSRYFVENPPVDLSKIVMMVNLDMVGRLNPDTKALTIGGTGTAVEFNEILTKLKETYPLNINFSPEGLGPSDHASFYAKNIPVLFFFTGVHEDYHTPADDHEKINYEAQKLISDLTYDVISNLAFTGNKLNFQEAGPKERQSPSSRMKVSLGIMPGYVSEGAKGVLVENVVPDKPAAKSGIQKGDIIVSINGKPVNDIYEYMDRMSTLNPGDVAMVGVERNKEIIEIAVNL
ncbi:MAG: M20/M25/M40 family metallo-hydrolase [Ignavibacteriaceae bacterium]|nr:M20/M25/M40 family metallo-hydrolase [Ignavibacteriaceae bacterium]